MEVQNDKAISESHDSQNIQKEGTNLLNQQDIDKNLINKQYINANGNRAMMNDDLEENQNTNEINIVLDFCENGQSHSLNLKQQNDSPSLQKPLLEITDKQINDSNLDFQQKLSNYLPKNMDLLPPSQSQGNSPLLSINDHNSEGEVKMQDATQEISCHAAIEDEFVIILSDKNIQEDNSKNEIKLHQNEANLDENMKEQNDEQMNRNQAENAAGQDVEMKDESDSKILKIELIENLIQNNSNIDKKASENLKIQAEKALKSCEGRNSTKKKTFQLKSDLIRNESIPPTEDYNERKNKQNVQHEQMEKQTSDANNSNSTVRQSNMRTRYNGQKKVVAESQLLQKQENDSANLNNKKKKSQRQENEGSSILNPELQKQTNITKSKSNLRQVNEIDSGLTNDKDVEASQRCKNESYDDSQDDQIMGDLGQNRSGELMKKSKKNNNNQFEQCKKLYRKMFQFYWDLKEFTNGRHSPKDDLTAGSFWFYMNTTYFPHNMFEILSDISEEEFVKQIQSKIQRQNNLKNLNSQLDQNQLNKIKINLDSDQIQNNIQIEQQELNDQPTEQNGHPNENEETSEKNKANSQVIQFLINKRKKYLRFKKYFYQLIYRVQNTHSHCFDDDQVMKQIRDQAFAIPRNPIVYPFQSELNKPESPTNYEHSSLLDPEKEIAEIKKNMMFENFQKVIYLAEQDLNKLSQENEANLKNLFDQTKQKYTNALDIPIDSEEYKDKTIYKPSEIHKYPQSFVSFVDPFFVQDMVKNKEWYLENTNQFMLNLNYPSKLQNDYLKELALAQQRRNDQRYKKIMQQMQEIVDSDEMQKQFQLQLRDFNQKQREIVQDDACCAICSSGDYEDDDQIVFCSRCSIPVHQSCFGLEKIPENDWICNNCYTFGFQRGLMVKCFLCPKRGGAMKPTNVFRSYEKYFEKKVRNVPKKSGKVNIEKLNSLVQNQQPTDLSEDQDDQQMNHVDGESCDRQSQIIQVFKQQILNRLENNCCLNELIQREFSYRDKFNQECEKAEKCPNNDQKEQEIAKLQLLNKIQDEFQLNFNKNEQSNHNIPEDFRDFISRNEAKLESSNAPITDSLYYWVHHSCSMWTQGPQVTPKTPVKMNKLDFQKFAIGCVICGQKGIGVGASVKCFKQDCQIYFHVECAKRANYCMEIEKKIQKNQKEKIFKIFCESHRPFKIIQEINEQNTKEIEDIQKFMKTIEKCNEAYQKWLQKPKKLLSKTERNKMVRQALQIRKSELVLIKKSQSKQGRPRKEKKEDDIKKKKKWKEKDKRQLLERVKEKYLQVKKMRFNMQKIDPMVQETKRYLKKKKRVKKLEEKRKKAEQNIIQNQELKRLIIENEMKRKERGLRGRVRLDQDESTEQILNQDRDNNAIIDQLNQGHYIPYIEHMEIADFNLNDYGENELKQLKTKIEQDQKEIESIDEIMPHPPILNQIAEYFESASPMTIKELEWKVTLSRYDFPWQEIAFAQFSSKECYKMYTSIVTDAQSFLKKVLGDKPKYQKMIKNQLEGLPTIDHLMNMQFLQKGQYVQDNEEMSLSRYQSYPPNYFNKNVHFVTSRIEDNMNSGFQMQGFQSQTQQIQANSQATLYCRCRGQVISDLMVACETGEDFCPNKGWLHPQCCEDLKDLSNEEIDKIDQWFCPDCINIKNKNDQLDNIKYSQSINEDARVNSIPKYSQPKHSQTSLIQIIKEESPFKNNNDKNRKSFIIKLGQDQQIIELEIDSNKNKSISLKAQTDDEYLNLQAQEQIEDIDLFQKQKRKDSHITQKTEIRFMQDQNVQKYNLDQQVKQEKEYHSIFQQSEQNKNSQKSQKQELKKQIESQMNEKKKKEVKRIPDMFNLHQLNSQQNVISFQEKNKQFQDKQITDQSKYAKLQNNPQIVNPKHQNHDNQKKMIEQMLCQLLNGAEKQTVEKKQNNGSLEQLLNDPQIFHKISQGLSKDQEQEKQQQMKIQIISDYIQSLIDQQDHAKKQQEQIQQKELLNRQQRQQQQQQQAAMQTLNQIIGFFNAQNNQQKAFMSSPLNPINMQINSNTNNFTIQQPQFSRAPKQNVMSSQQTDNQDQAQNLLQMLRLIEQNAKENTNQQQQNMMQQQEELNMYQKLIQLQKQNEQLQMNRPQLQNPNLNTAFVQQQLSAINEQHLMSNRQGSSQYQGSQRIHSQSQNTQRHQMINQQEEEDFSLNLNEEQIQMLLSQFSNINK